MNHVKDGNSHRPVGAHATAEQPPKAAEIDADYVRWCAEYCLHLARGRAVH